MSTQDLVYEANLLVSANMPIQLTHIDNSNPSPLFS